MNIFFLGPNSLKMKMNVAPCDGRLLVSAGLLAC